MIISDSDEIGRNRDYIEKVIMPASTTADKPVVEPFSSKPSFSFKGAINKLANGNQFNVMLKNCVKR